MAYKVFDNLSEGTVTNTDSSTQKIILDSDGQARVDLPDATYVSDANITRDGIDLVLETPEGTVVVEGYFAAEPTPHLVSPDGTSLTPNLVESFIRGDSEYADLGSVTDASPVGAIQEISGEATVTRLDGTVEVAGIGTPIYQGDVVETNEEGAVNIMFIDQTTFAVSEDARLAIDEYVFDPATQSGTTNFSVLKGVFVFTSGLIGREDPDDVMIETPSGSIGIRGTIIAGDVDAGEITVIEGAIVLYDFAGNTLTLSNQYETAKFNLTDNTIEHVGELEATEVSAKFMSVSTVAADLFSTIEDSATEQQDNQAPETQDTGADGDKDASVDTDDGNTETAALDDDIITSDDITGSDLDNADDTVEDDVVEASDDDGDSEETTEAGSGSGETEGGETVVNDQPEAPFNITIDSLSFTENVNGSAVARVTGNNTDMTNLTLAGTSANYYEFIREDDNTFLISLKTGVTLDAEDPYSLYITASNESGAATVTQAIGLDVTNVDEAITYENIAPNVSGIDNYFSGSDDTVLTYDMSQEFNDPEGDIQSYSFVGGPPVHTDISSVSLDADTGLLTVTLNGAVSDGNFNFTVRAQTGGELLDQTFTFDIMAATTGAPVLATNDQTYSGNAATITVAANNAEVFSNIDDSENTVLLSGNNAYIQTGGGDDTITINAGSYNYHAYGDSGDDQFNISQALGKSYGGDGNDTFVVMNNTVQGDLEGLGSNVALHGGAGFDVIAFNTSGAVDFNNINAGFIEHIEAVHFENAMNNTIDLSYNDVINMTDGDNRLLLNLDDNDTLNFTNTSPNNFVQAQNTVEVNGENYNVFTDGTITLLVDVEAAAVNGII